MDIPALKAANIVTRLEGFVFDIGHILGGFIGEGHRGQRFPVEIVGSIQCVAGKGANNSKLGSPQQYCGRGSRC